MWTFAEQAYLDNPKDKTHGAPSDEERHVGDLGNFKTDGSGNAKGSHEDKLIKLIGPESVIGVSGTSQAGHEYKLNQCCSAPLLSTPALMISERATTPSLRRPVSCIIHQCFTVVLMLSPGNAGARPACGVIGIAAQ